MNPSKDAHAIEAQVWREIAETIINTGAVEFGLCAMIPWELPCLVATRMSNRSCFYADSSYAYPRGTEPEARAMAALWMACEAEAGVEP